MDTFELKNGIQVYAPCQEAIDEGEFYLRVTHVLDVIQHKKLENYKINNTRKAQEKRLEETGEIGTKIHSMVEADLSGTPKVEEGFEKINQNWQEIKTKYEITSDKSEQVICSPTHGYAGRFDYIGNIKGKHDGFESPTTIKRSVQDIKSGWYSIKTGWQMASYKYALEEVGQEKDLGMAGINLHRDGDVKKVFVYSRYRECFIAFLCALNDYRMLYYPELRKLKWKWLNHCPLEIKI